MTLANRELSLLQPWGRTCGWVEDDERLEGEIKSWSTWSQTTWKMRNQPLRFQVRTCKLWSTCVVVFRLLFLWREGWVIFSDNLLHPLCFHHQLQMGGYYNRLGLSHTEQITVSEIFLMKTMYSVTQEKVFNCWTARIIWWSGSCFVICITVTVPVRSSCHVTAIPSDCFPLHLHNACSMLSTCSSSSCLFFQLLLVKNGK